MMVAVRVNKQRSSMTGPLFLVAILHDSCDKHLNSWLMLPHKFSALPT
jgi:hypothetical protein